MNFLSIYKEKFAGKTVYWLPMDTEELYNYNIKNKLSELSKYNWVDKVIEYKFNSEGFRCKEFASEPNIMFLGCSNTLGIGIPAENRWTDLVASSLGLHCYNLGQAAAASDTAFRLALGWIDKLKPKILIFRRPPGIRIELVDKDKIDYLTIDNLHGDIITYTNSLSAEFILRYAEEDINNELNFLKNCMAINLLCKERDIKYCWIDSDTADLINGQEFKSKNIAVDDLDLGRDLAHSGVKYNAKIAELVLAKI